MPANYVPSEQPELSLAIDRLTYPIYVDRSINRMRGTVIIESGTVTTVTTVTTVAALTNIDSQQGRLLPLGAASSAWYQLVRSRIT